MSKNIKIICNERLLCGEGPVWVPQYQKLYWTDSNGTNIRCYNANDESWQVINDVINASSLALHADGGLIFGSKTGFYHLDKNGNIDSIAQVCDEEHISNINDLIADSLGRVYGGQECFDPEHKYETGYLYKINLDRSVSIIEEGLHLSNGMGFSPDLKSFYLVDTITRTIYLYDFNLTSGTVANKKIFTILDKNEGLPDGLTVDSEGYVWVARFLGNGLSRYDPDGKIERKIELPFAQPTSLTFGGKNYNQIFVTSASLYWETDFAPNNHDYKMPRGGELIKIEQNIIGKPEYLARI